MAIWDSVRASTPTPSPPNCREEEEHGGVGTRIYECHCLSLAGMPRKGLETLPAQARGGGAPGPGSWTWLRDQPCRRLRLRRVLDKQRTRRDTSDEKQIRCSEDYRSRLTSECFQDLVCPERCRCEGTVVDCSNLRLTNLPTHLPEHTTDLLPAPAEAWGTLQASPGPSALRHAGSVPQISLALRPRSRGHVTSHSSPLQTRPLRSSITP
ncbi:hypothetical protein P4O66_003879 [Electrophorus voltai]|uniref:LRRNT domain-containing protein n=1 Tax=Electrophorus voltai TaxID=2609070 RepID=A0AAD9E1V5_9TELE|nr:hypothetical protein P4O66_003879 [Electrophorus voltai]